METYNYTEIASDYKLWQEYADPSGLTSEAEFESTSLGEKVAFLVTCFGPEES